MNLKVVNEQLVETIFGISIADIKHSKVLESEMRRKQLRKLSFSQGASLKLGKERRYSWIEILESLKDYEGVRYYINEIEKEDISSCDN